jgi:hypothetical protein
MKCSHRNVCASVTVAGEKVISAGLVCADCHHDMPGYTTQVDARGSILIFKDLSPTEMVVQQEANNEPA